MCSAPCDPITSRIVHVETALRGLSVATGRGRIPRWGAHPPIARRHEQRLLHTDGTTALLSVTEVARATPAYWIEVTICAEITLAPPLPAAVVRQPGNIAMLGSACRPYCLDLIALLTGRMGFPPAILPPD